MIKQISCLLFYNPTILIFEHYMMHYEMIHNNQSKEYKFQFFYILHFHNIIYVTSRLEITLVKLIHIFFHYYFVIYLCRIPTFLVTVLILLEQLPLLEVLSRTCQYLERELLLEHWIIFSFCVVLSTDTGKISNTSHSP